MEEGEVCDFLSDNKDDISSSIPVRTIIRTLFAADLDLLLRPLVDERPNDTPQDAKPGRGPHDHNHQLCVGKREVLLHNFHLLRAIFIAFPCCCLPFLGLPTHRTYRSLGVVLANKMDRPPQEVKGLARCG